MRGIIITSRGSTCRLAPLHRIIKVHLFGKVTAENTWELFILSHSFCYHKFTCNTLLLFYIITAEMGTAFATGREKSGMFLCTRVFLHLGKSSSLWRTSGIRVVALGFPTLYTSSSSLRWSKWLQSQPAVSEVTLEGQSL